MDLRSVVVFVGGLALLVIGSEVILRSSSRIAAMLGLKPIIIGLTVVSVGTSMPELAVGITAVGEGRGAMAAGNIAGTNILNILFILGLSAAIRPLKLQLLSLRLDVPVMIGAAVVLFLMALDGILSRLEGAILFVAAIVYVYFLIRLTKREGKAMRKEFEEEYSKEVLLKKKPGKWALVGNAAILVVGLAVTILGADLLVNSAVVIATGLGITDAVIGLTIVAIGTSAPELATTIVATIKDDRDVAVGNLIGSSISNVLVILGITCMVAPSGVEVSRDVLLLDLPLAAAVAIACYPVFRSNQRVSRIEGIVFVSLYVLYLGTLIFIRA